MSLVFAAITPHPPVLLPSIGREATAKLAKTTAALQRLEEDLYLAKPNILIVISPHGGILPDAFTLNVCGQFQADWRSFGDLTTELSWRGEPHLPYLIREAAKTQNIPTTLISEPKLDYGTSIPLSFLTPHLPPATILPISFSGLDYKTHFNFGTLLKEQILKINQRVAVIASADLSHALTTEAPAGFHPAGAEFDNTVQKLLSAGNTTGLLQLDASLVKPAAECGLRSLLILLGILRNLQYSFEAYAYEAPFGVGYLTANFVL